MKEEIIHLKPEEALELLDFNSDKSVHTQKQLGNMFIGADNSYESIKKSLEEAEDIQVGGENCQAMGHGIVIFPKNAKYQSDLLFVAHNKEKIKQFN